MKANGVNRKSCLYGQRKRVGIT